MLIHKRNSQNFNDRPKSQEVDTIVIHSMFAQFVEPELQFDPDICIATLDQESVSAHYVISREGEIYQLVDEELRAWHAGVSQMPDLRENVNDFSLGIELIGSPESGFTDLQYEALIRLTINVCSRHKIKHFVGHDQIAPGRKTDPGANFDWNRYLSALSPA
ncbi:MAG: 1,6-anhydro-N-acetylmuramyl-L-alanine amidase AmpD [Deltaproteobacteria bacterium]|nr:1,6-anhydro-N-acetylmuramyl-L-alanine amidase AmpD [Deltaproteobacteria bacterium]